MHPLIDELKRRRLQIGLTQERLAELSGIAQPNIARIETGGVFHSRTYDRILAAIVAHEREQRLAASQISEAMNNGPH